MKIARGWHRLAIAYCLLTFVLSWLAWILAADSGDSIVHFRIYLFSLSLTRRNLLALLGNCVPGIVATSLVLLGNKKPLPLLVQIRFPRCSAFLVLFALTVPIGFGFLLLFAEDGVFISTIKLSQFVVFCGTFVLNLFAAPLWEEIGWRGFLLPTLLKMNSGGGAIVILGAIWGIWHLALYLVVEKATLLSFGINFMAIVAVSAILSVLYLVSERNLVLPVVFHASWNAGKNWMHQIEPTVHAHSLVLQTMALWAVAGIVWVFFREEIRQAGAHSHA